METDMSEVALSNLKVPHMRKFASNIGYKPDPKLGAEALAAELADRLRTEYPGCEILACQECKFPAPDHPDLKTCPGCAVTFLLEEDRDPHPKKSKSPKMKLAPVEPEVLVPMGLTEASGMVSLELDRITKRIQELRVDFSVNAWEIGTALREIHDRDLWKARYGSFHEYVEQQCGFGYGTARDFIQIAKAFTVEEVRSLPVASVRMVAKAPEGDRKALLEKVREERPTTRELAEQVKTKRAEAGLETERRGLAGTVVVNARLKPGVVTTCIGTKTPTGRMVFTFSIGEQTFHLATDNMLNAELILDKPASAREE